MCPVHLGILDPHQIKPVGRCDRGTGGTIAPFERGGDIGGGPLALANERQRTYH